MGRRMRRCRSLQRALVGQTTNNRGPGVWRSSWSRRSTRGPMMASVFPEAVGAHKTREWPWTMGSMLWAWVLVRRPNRAKKACQIWGRSCRALSSMAINGTGKFRQRRYTLAGTLKRGAWDCKRRICQRNCNIEKNFFCRRRSTDRGKKRGYSPGTWILIRVSPPGRSIFSVKHTTKMSG